MKRFISTLCLLVGASVASYAGMITSTAGLGGSSTLQDFNGAGPTNTLASFPLASLAALPVGGSVTVSVTSSSTVTPGDVSTKNTGGTGSLRDIAGDGNLLLSTQNLGNTADPNNFARNIIFTFSAPISAFLIDYKFSDNATNYFLLNGTTKYVYGAGTGQVGANDGSISSITFVTFGNDSGAGLGGDVVLFDNLRVVTGAVVSSGSSGSSSSGTPGVPEPSTYALIGAGLVSLAYARRKK